MIRHKSEYVSGEVHTQGIESFWALLKRGLIGTHHQVDAGYLNQYVQEFAFRANTCKVSDPERFETLMKCVEGRVDWYVGKQAASASGSRSLTALFTASSKGCVILIGSSYLDGRFLEVIGQCARESKVVVRGGRRLN